MAATYRSSSSANTGAAAASSLQLSAPAGIQVGDLLIAAITTDGTPTYTAPSDWTLVRSTNQSTAPTSKMVIYSKQVTGHESWPYTWTLSVAEQAAGVIVAYSGSSGFVPTITLTSSTSHFTASTSLVDSSLNTIWSGLMLTFWGTRNTTGTSTLTAASGWTGRVDTCTTASTFIEAEAQESPVQPLPVATISGNTSTASQSVTSVGTNIFVEDGHMNTPLCIDDVFKNTWSTAQTTSVATISTNYNAELIVGCIALETGASLSVSSVTATGLTFNKLTTISTQGGDCEVWYAVASALQANVAITASFTSNTSGSFTVFGVAGIDLTNSTGSSAFGAIATNNGAASSIASATLTTTRNNSWVMGVSNSSSSSKLNSGSDVGSGQTALQVRNTSTTSSSLVAMQSTPTATSGTSVTMSSSSNVVLTWNMIAFEILPSLGHGLSSGGAGL